MTLRCSVGEVIGGGFIVKLQRGVGEGFGGSSIVTSRCDGARCL